MFRVIFYCAVLIPSFLFLVFSAKLMWQSDLMNIEVSDASLELLNTQVEYPGYVFEPIKRFLYEADSETNIDQNIFFDNLQLYLSRNPLDADAWLFGSKFYQQSGNIELAALYLSVAHALSESNTPVLLKVFNRYLELNLIDEAMPVAHDIAVAKPHEFRRLFYLMSRLSSDFSRVVDKVIPKQVLNPKFTVKDSLDVKNVYYQWAILDSIRAQNTLLSKEVWKVISPDEKVGNIIGVNFLNYLSQFQKLDIFKDVWEEVVNKPLVSGELLNYVVEGSSPCWHIKSNESVDVDISRGDDILLQIDFLGKDNVAYNHLRCLSVVSPNNKYKLTGRYKSKNISTLSGVFVDVYFPGFKKTVGRTEGIVGSSKWTNFDLNFEVPSDIVFVEFRIRRNSSSLLDNKISGTVWFDSLELSLNE